MLSVAICDDESAVLSRLETLTMHCLNGKESELRTFDSREELARAVSEGWKPDVALLDIRLPREDGICLAKRLFPEGSRTQVIFVTGYPEYQSEVYETEHVWMLTKPVKEEKLRRALEKAISLRDRKMTRMLTVRTGSVLLRIPVETIHCAEASGRKVILRCLGEQVEYYGTLEKLSKKLPRSFIRCHRSYFVNLEHVIRLESDQITLESGEIVPIGRTRRTQVRMEYLAFLRRER